MNTETVTIIIGILTFFGGIITSFIGNSAIKRKNEKDAQNELRDDLMLLFKDQQIQITKLNEDLIAIRYKNIELIENLNKEREAASKVRTVNDNLQLEVEHLKEDRARLANQVMILEEQIRQLKHIIQELQQHSVGYQTHMQRATQD